MDIKNLPDISTLSLDECEKLVFELGEYINALEDPLSLSVEVSIYCTNLLQTLRAKPKVTAAKRSAAAPVEVKLEDLL